MANWTRLSTNQRAVLALIEEASPSSISNAQIAARLQSPPEGTAQTAASLVRRGIVERRRERGRVCYLLAPPKGI